MDFKYHDQPYPLSNTVSHMNCLHADSIMKSFDTNKVLTDIFLTCKPGEIIGLLGRNGSGKSTLMKILFGALKADQKFVKANEKMIHYLHDRIGLISYLPQDNFLPPHVTVKTMIRMLCSKRAAHDLFEKPYLRKMLNRRGRQLSGGEKRVIEIFLTIHSDAKYILLDEPFNGVAPLYIDDIKDTIRQEAKDGKGFILTDHDYRNILDVSDRIIFLHDGGTRDIVEVSELEKWGYLLNSEF